MQNNSSLQPFVFRRLAAFVYDTFLLIAVFFVVTSIAMVFNKGQAITNPLFYLLLYAVGFMFFSWFWRKSGQTLGMQAWRIQVISETSEQLTYKQCLLRYVIATLLFGFTLLAALLSKQGKAPHDSLSRTRIIFKNKEL